MNKLGYDNSDAGITWVMHKVMYWHFWCYFLMNIFNVSFQIITSGKGLATYWTLGHLFRSVSDWEMSLFVKLSAIYIFSPTSDIDCYFYIFSVLPDPSCPSSYWINSTLFLCNHGLGTRQVNGGFIVGRVM